VYIDCTPETVRGCVNLKKYKSQGKAVESVEVTVNIMEENSYDFCLDFIQEFGHEAKNFGCSEKKE